MKHDLMILASLLAVTLQASAQTGTEWDDPKTTSVNREKAHTVCIPLGQETGDMASSPWYQSLDGKWKFMWVKQPSLAKDEYCAKDYNAASWTDIDVPSSWQVWGLHHGMSWDKPLYCNVAYPFSFNESTYSVMASRPAWFTYNSNMPNPVGTYRRTFTIPASWAGRDVFVRFNSVGHGYYLWVNGKRVGYSEDSYLPSEFNITSYLTEGENTIALQVYRFTSGSFLECQDYWRLTGIHRSCFLWSAPKSQIRDFFFLPNLNTAFKAAKSSVKVTLTGVDAISGGTVEGRLIENGVVVAQSSKPVAATLSLTLNVTAPRLWSAETPNLYDLVVTLKDVQGNTVDIRSSKVGFRKVAIRSDGALTINGQRMVFHGVNRHDFSPFNGRAITPAEIEEDIKTMKRLNINAVRTSHYPNDPVFYDLCDRYGLYVLAEADVECHANTKLSSVQLFRPAMVERSENQVLWMRNHPCIFMWSFGNESGDGDNFKYVNDAIKALDNTRLTHYEGGKGSNNYADVTSSMYWDYNGIQNVGVSQKDRPHIQCENSHSMGNSMGNVRDMFDLYERYPCLTGEFIWDFKDQGLLTKSSSGMEYWAYGGDFGDNPNDGNFCINGLVKPDWSLTAKSYNTKKVYQPLEFKTVTPNGSATGEGSSYSFRMKNKMAFNPSTVYDVSYEVVDELGSVLAQGDVTEAVAAGDSAVVTIDNLKVQGSRVMLQGAQVDPDEEVFIHFIAKQRQATLWAEAGYVVAEEKLPLQTAVRPMYKPAAAEALTVSEGDDITVSNTHFTATFSKQQGTLTGYASEGLQMLAKPLQLNVFRLPTDNDGRQSASWDNAGLRKLTVKGNEARVESADDGQTVTVTLASTYTGKNGTAFDVNMQFIVCADGTIMTSAFIRPVLTGAILPKMGFRLEMPAAMEQLTWFGRGPWDSYRDRKEACLPGIYQSTVTGQYEEYILPQEHGTKQEVRWMSLTNQEGRGLLFAAPDQMAASAVHFRPEDNYTDRNTRSRHTYQFKPCDNTVVCLDAATRGLGNASCGPDVMEKYELHAQNIAFQFFIMPLKLQVSNFIPQISTLPRYDIPVCKPVSCTRMENGSIMMTTPTEGATIYYSINGGEYQKYTSPLELNEACTITAYSAAEGMTESLRLSYDFPLFVSKSEWKLVSVDSQQGGNEATKAFDNNTATFWHTEWGANEPTHPHTIVIDMVNTYKVTAFTYLSRQDGNQNGMVKAYEFYLSNDGQTWGNPVASGQFNNTTAMQTATLATPTAGRYLKLVAKSEINGNAWTSAAEIGIEAETYQSASVTNHASSVTPSGSVYDLQGRRFAANLSPKGIIIQNGRKTFNAKQ